MEYLFLRRNKYLTETTLWWSGNHVVALTTTVSMPNNLILKMGFLGSLLRVTRLHLSDVTKSSLILMILRKGGTQQKCTSSGCWPPLFSYEVRERNDGSVSGRKADLDPSRLVLLN
jgi:hypothetical protein